MNFEYKGLVKKNLSFSVSVPLSTGTVDTLDTITVTVSYEQMPGDIFGHRKDIARKWNKTKTNVREIKIPCQETWL